MERDVECLEEEIELLKKRIAILEKAENRRKASKYAKMIWKIVLICAIAFGIWRCYDYIVHGIPNMIEEKIKAVNPFKRG